MQDSTTKTAAGGRLPTFGPDTIETLMRARVRTTIEAIVQEELDAALGAAKSVRVGETRQGYRHGSRERTLTTSLGPATIQIGSAANNGPKRFHQYRTVPWQMSMPRSHRRSSTCLSDKG